MSGNNVYLAGSVSPPAGFGSYTINTPTTNSVGFLASLADPTLTATAPALRPESIGLFPNPARGKATIQLPAIPGAPTATLIILDALGRTLRTQTANANTKAELDLTGFAPGLYTVRVQAGSSTATHKLVVE
ncbi:T9SS type A sorting domain-containing protein [Hymenobacter negativus]|uniref:T9SS type A sorting domain-containing protein n=1 Tax=Hymenobacter negativus TaxID=2795026 RepID=A0ABS3QMD5_9BACT|nr:T9SS type A sorting domain-containing protein [Hymenobacter negativus]MBO2012435.1 T9SS type A sorting domain-containing protein [Hymenobacter negativus]